MKKVDLLKVEKEAVAMALMAATSGKSTHSEIRKMNKISDKLETEGDGVELEDDQYSFLMEKLNQFNGWLTTKEARKLVTAIFDKLEAVK